MTDKTITMKPESMDIARLVPFEGHPFQVKDDAEMRELMKSIEEQGILTPITVRRPESPDTGQYEVISGHRRLFAAKALGMSNVPILICSTDRDTAIAMMVDSNLHREHILPSEKAFAYKMKLEAMDRKLGRPKNADQVGSDYRGQSSAELIGSKAGDSASQVKRYIRLTKLIPEILRIVDAGKIALTPAVELSYLSEAEQKALYITMDYDEVTPSLSQAQRLRRVSQERGLSEEEIISVLSEEKGNEKEYFKLPREAVGKYFRPGTTAKQISETLVKAMDDYIRHRNHPRNAR